MLLIAHDSSLNYSSRTEMFLEISGNILLHSKTHEYLLEKIKAIMLYFEKDEGSTAVKNTAS